MDQQVLIFAGAGVFLLVLFLVGVVVWQRNRIKELQRPKYGFLGKPLMAIVATLVLGVGLVGGVYLTQQESVDPRTSADLDVNITIEKELKGEGERVNSYIYELEAIPEVDEVPYGESTEEKFNIYWNVLGPVKISESEIGITKQNPSGIEVELKEGTYKVNVLIVYKEKSFNYSEDLVI
jgi:hypothetical protein